MVRRHFIKVSTVCLDKSNIQGRKYIKIKTVSTCDPLKIHVIVSKSMGKCTRMRRVSVQVQLSGGFVLYLHIHPNRDDFAVSLGDTLPTPHEPFMF